VDDVEDRIAELSDFEVVVLWAFVLRPGVDPAKIATALKGSSYRLRGWRVRRAVRRLVKRELLSADDGGAERYAPHPDAARLVPVAMATREIGDFMPEHLAADRAWAAGRRRSNWWEP
jgi:hypothetical protein